VEMVTDLSVACTFFDLMALAKALFRSYSDHVMPDMLAPFAASGQQTH